MRKLILCIAGLVLVFPAQAAGARFALVVERGFSAQRLAERIEARTGRSVSIIGPFAVALNAPSADGLASMRGVAYVERLEPERRLSFVPNDPLALRQWYLDRNRAFAAWPRLPVLARVPVAVLDSGVDAEHPELRDQILAGRSFVASSWRRDTNGHGTFVAGQIAAALNNGQGIAGMAFPAQLLVAKVVRGDGTISPEAEARAIRWAVDEWDARVINLSFSGLRDPFDADRDTYSPLEAAAIEYAVRRNVLVVAAVGNADKAPEEPWGYASYPAALPHVVGVSALRRDGSVPDFSNRDPVYNDLAAPGEEIFSTLPYAVTEESRPNCVLQGYSDCGPAEFRRGEGTSFAAPQVSAAAALVFAESPLLQAEQVATILERSALDATPARGCSRCWFGRDLYTGWGALNVAAGIAALDGAIPDPDWREPNDEAGTHAPYLWGKRGHRLTATLDYWDDQIDVYRVRLRRGQRIRVTLRGPGAAETSVLLWKPGTRRVEGLAFNSRQLAARATVGGSLKRIRYRSQTSGWYYLQVKITTAGAGRYGLRVVKLRPRLTGSRAARLPAPREAGEPGSQPR